MISFFTSKTGSNSSIMEKYTPLDWRKESAIQRESKVEYFIIKLCYRQISGEFSTAQLTAIPNRGVNYAIRKKDPEGISR